MKVFGKHGHRFLCTDPGSNRLLWFGEDGTVERSIKVQANCFDVWQTPEGHLVYPHFFGGSDGVTVLDNSGNTLWDYQTAGEVFGCQPLENGHILVGEVAQMCITEIAPDGTILRKIPVVKADNPHETMRMPRKYSDGYLVVQPGLLQIAEFDCEGRPTGVLKTRHDTFGVVKKSNGNMLYTCMEGVYELDSNGHEVWSLTNTDVPDIHICWLLGIQLLDNGNLVLSNWMGHGHNKEGIPFFEVNPQKEVVWYCDCREEAVIPSSLQILDDDPVRVCFDPRR